MVTDTYTNGVYVYLEKIPDRVDRLTFTAAGETFTKKRTITEQRYEIRGLSRSVAETGAAALASATVTATAKSSGRGPMWHIEVVEITVGAWGTEA